MKKRWGILVFGALGFGLLFQGCSKGSGEEGRATAKLQFANVLNPGVSWYQKLPGLVFGFPALAATSSLPTEFQMKLIAAYITEDIDPITQNNVGNTGIFYLNPDCADDIMHCDISGGTAEDGQPMSRVINNFFNFNQNSDLVNAELNAQGKPIFEGSYRYVRLEFCKYNAGNSKNIKWAGGGATGTQEAQRNSCSVNSARIDPPISVAEGDSINVKLAYDLTGAVQTGSDAQGEFCTGTSGTAGYTCFRLPTFVPSATKN